MKINIIQYTKLPIYALIYACNNTIQTTKVTKNELTDFILENQNRQPEEEIKREREVLEPEFIERLANVLRDTPLESLDFDRINYFLYRYNTLFSGDYYNDPHRLHFLDSLGAKDLTYINGNEESESEESQSEESESEENQSEESESEENQSEESQSEENDNNDSESNNKCEDILRKKRKMD